MGWPPARRRDAQAHHTTEREREGERERSFISRYTTRTLHGSALSLSIRHHDETAKALRHAGATHGSKGSHASSADLIDAASKGDLDAVKRLVEEQKIPIDVGDYDSRTPLHLAAGEGRQV